MEASGVLGGRGIERRDGGGGVHDRRHLLLVRCRSPRAISCEGRLAHEDLGEAIVDLVDLAQLLLLAVRQPDRPLLVRQRPHDGLLDPPGGVRAEADVLAVIVLFDGAHEPDVAFLDQVEDGDLGREVVLGDAHDEPKVALDELQPRGLVALLDAARERQLLLEGQQAGALDLVEVCPEVVLDRWRHILLPAQLMLPAIIMQAAMPNMLLLNLIYFIICKISEYYHGAIDTH